MKRFGVLLALLVLFGTLAVGTGTVSATGGDIRDLKFDVVFYFTSNTLSFDVVQSKISGTLVGNVFTFSKSYDNVEYVHKLIDLGNGEWKLVICNMTLDPIMVFTSDNTHFFAPNNFPDEGAFEKIPYQRAFDSFVSQLDISAELKNMYLLTNDSRIPGGAFRILWADGYSYDNNDIITFSVSKDAVNSTYIVLGFNDWGTGGAKVLSLIYTDGSNTTLTSDGVKVEAYKIPTTLHIETGGHSKLFYVVVVTTDFSAGISPTSQNGRWWYGAAGDVVTYHLTVYAKDGLTGQALTGVTVKDGSGNVWTVNDGTSIEIPAGSHTLTFEKTGYWSTTATVDVQNDTSLFVVMYPSSAAFKFENFPSDISIPENTIYTLTFTFSPITTDATYNTYLSISGLSDLIEVQKDGSVISPESGKYYLGDVSSPVQVSIKFKAGAVGQHGFTLSVESHDAIMSKTYTTTKSVTYTVEPLPFSVQMPSEWQVGTNTLRISESSGQSYLITAVLKDSSGNEVWSDSHAFSPYEAYSFSVNVPSEGSYTLELQWNGQVAVYDVTVNPAIALTTKTLTVEKGGEGTIVLHFKNPSSDVQYYTIKVSGGFLPSEINQSISVGPLTEKDVSIAFAVPEELTYDAYELNVQVLQGNATVFQDKVAVSIGDSGGFTLFGGSSGNTWLWLGVGGLGLLALVGLARRR